MTCNFWLTLALRPLLCYNDSMGIVYRAECLVSGKSYIGYTKQKLKSRRKAHKEAYRHPDKRSAGQSIFYQAIREHGWSTFRWHVEFVSNDVEELLTKEEELIMQYDTLDPNGYNTDTSRARPVRDDVTGIVYSSIREASRETNTGHVHLMRSANTGTSLANGKKFSWFDPQNEQKD